MGQKYRIKNEDSGLPTDQDFELMEIIEVYRLTNENFPELLVWANWTEQVEEENETGIHGL